MFRAIQLVFAADGTAPSRRLQGRAQVAPAPAAAETRSLGAPKELVAKVTESGLQLVDLQRLKAALALFRSGPEPGGGEVISTAFGSLWGGLMSRLARWQNEPDSERCKRNAALVQAHRYASYRLSDPIGRLFQIRWVRELLAPVEKEPGGRWFGYAGFAVRDFHIDIGSFMDSLVPFVLQIDGPLLMGKDARKLPGFADISGDSPRSKRLRAQIPTGVLDRVDSTERWWPTIKAVRDRLLHREYQSVVFRTPSAGVLFQIYEANLAPCISDPAFLSPDGHNVVDFSVYSAFVVAEVFMLADEIGSLAASHLGMTEDELPPSWMTSPGVGGSIEQLIAKETGAGRRT